MSHKRSNRVADLLQQEIADLLLRRVKDPRVVGVTITGVDISVDLQNARVFFCVMAASAREQKEAALAGLNRAKGFIRQELGKRLRLRYLPQIEFQYDTSFEYGDKIERLLKELQENE